LIANLDLSLLVPALVSLLHVLAAIAVTFDAVLRKQHVSSVIGWVGLAWLAPVIGSVVYLCFGINRIRRKAAALDPRGPWQRIGNGAPGAGDESQAWLEIESLAGEHPSLLGLATLGNRITARPLQAGNRVAPLINGDEAFPAMLAAIDAARLSVTLVSYIFDSDEVGTLFLEALCRAGDRGVDVRVLIDDVGARYAKPTMLRLMSKRGVPAAAFLRTRAPRLFRYANLRNHRKIMVVDGTVGFIGGTNIRDAHWLAKKPRYPVRCLHFRLDGPIVEDLQRTFAMDWAFTTGELLRGDRWFPLARRCGPVLARGVRDGPDEDLDKILELLIGALSVAQQRVRIMTPYFIVPGVLSRMLQVTALRGVDVQIVLPVKSNLPFIDWAMAPQLPALLEKGCRIYLSPQPFDHTKLMVVDGIWSLIGSSNWDTRSLRLNFEYNVECYDEELAGRLDRLAGDKIAEARPLTLAETQGWSFTARLRNGLARLLSPYL
jgi:cardiolipin synthase A/B